MKSLKVFRMYADALVDDCLVERYLMAADEEEAWGIAYNYALRSNVLDSGSVDVEEVKIQPCVIPSGKWLFGKQCYKEVIA